MSEINPKLLEQYAKCGLNVMFSGPHGVGKSTVVIDVFEKLFPGKWAYFSGATMDPWTDLIGIPQPQEGEDGQKYVEFLRPQTINSEIEAIFIDEYNRAHKKVRNATMELIQFKKINGKLFPNLKVVWAAENPPNEGNFYDVEETDPAQKDRFHIHIRLTNAPDIKYFKKKYQDMGAAAVDWWSKQNSEVQKIIPPRRLETALQVFSLVGNLNNVFDPVVDIDSLQTSLGNVSKIQNLDSIVKLIKSGCIDEANQLYGNLVPSMDSFYNVSSLLLEDLKYIPLVAECCTEEQLVALLSNASTSFTVALESYDPKQNQASVSDVLNEIRYSMWNFFTINSDKVVELEPKAEKYFVTNEAKKFWSGGLRLDVFSDEVEELRNKNHSDNDLHVVFMRDMFLLKAIAYVFQYLVQSKEISKSVTHEIEAFNEQFYSVRVRQTRVYENRGFFSFVKTVSEDFTRDLMGGDPSIYKNQQTILAQESLPYPIRSKFYYSIGSNLIPQES